MNELSLILLAGGYSSRMHRNKAELILEGKTLLQWQVDKFRTLGVKDIVISGYADAPEGTRYVPDFYPHRGPLSGMHASLSAIANERAFVISVDAPLIPREHLLFLAQQKTEKAVITVHEGQWEPLIGIYGKAMSPLCEEILKTEHTSVRELLKKTGVLFAEYTGDPLGIANCNTPEEYQRFVQGIEKNRKAWSL